MAESYLYVTIDIIDLPELLRKKTDP